MIMTLHVNLFVNNNKYSSGIFVLLLDHFYDVKLRNKQKFTFRNFYYFFGKKNFLL